MVGHLVGQPADDVKLLAFASAVDMKRIVFHRAPKPSLERHYQSNPTVISYTIFGCSVAQDLRQSFHPSCASKVPNIVGLTV